MDVIPKTKQADAKKFQSSPTLKVTIFCFMFLNPSHCFKNNIHEVAKNGRGEISTYVNKYEILKHFNANVFL